MLGQKTKKDGLSSQVYLIALVWLVIVGVSLGVGWPNWQKIIKIQKQVENKQKELVRLVEKQNALGSLDEMELEGKVQRTIQVLPVQQDFAGYLASIRHLASSHNLIVRSYSLSPGLIKESGLVEEAERGKVPNKEKGAKVGKGPQVFEIQALISGNAEDMTRFFRQLEKSAPIKSVPEATLSVDSSAVGLLRVTAKLTFRAYYQPLPNVLPPIVSKLPVLSDQQNQLLTDLFKYEMAPRLGLSDSQARIGKTNIFAQ